MKRGLVIGKFMPIHQGHIALIQFAATQCDELIVSMSYTDQDPVPHQLRYSWIQHIFENDHNIKPALVKDDFDDESLPWPERTKRWASFLKKQYGVIQVIVSSEEYGAMLAEHLGAIHSLFDQGRIKNPVSASLIRERPFLYWNFIPPVVRPYFVKKICFYGPESTGKSFMSRHLAQIYQTHDVPEVAREMIDSNAFTLDDIIKIGHAQTDRVVQRSMTANKILFCDTDLITTQIYCRHYLGTVPDVLYELEKKITYDQYFLFHIDVPWVADGLRDLHDQRADMFTLFKDELVKRKLPFIEIRGSYAQRENLLRDYCDHLLERG